MCTPHDLLREPHAVHGIDFLEPIHNVKEVETKSRRGIAAAELLSSYLENKPANRPTRHISTRPSPSRDGGAYRDRTDDLKLAKLALSQLS